MTDAIILPGDYWDEPMNYIDEQYLALGQLIKDEGTWLEHERTGLRRKTWFHYVFDYNLQEQFPIITTKAVAWKTAIKEMMAYMDGVRNINEFRARGLKTWDQSYERWSGKNGAGDMGPLYGVKWTETFGAVISKLKRRHDDGNLYITAVSPADEGKMCLPACMHTHRWQLDGETLHQVSLSRSADICLGLPFNMVQAGWLLLHVCELTDLKPGRIIHIVDNAHVYEPHYELFLKQLDREPKNSRPRFNIKTGQLENYKSCGPINYENVG